MRKSLEKQKVIVRSFDRENEEKEAFVGINGKSYQIKLDVEVELTEDVINVLKDAVMKSFVQETDERGSPIGKIRERNIPRYIVEKV